MTAVLTELRALLRLATPIAAARLGFILLGIVDTAVVGRLGEIPLGAVGLANALFFAFVMFGGGLVMGIDPLITQALGADESELAESGLWQGLWLSALLSLPLCLVAALSTALLAPIGVEAETARQASIYLWSRIPALPLLLAFTAMRTFLQAHGLTRPMVIGVAVANILNLPFNLILVFGDGALQYVGLPGIGLPALGILGAGITSTLVTAVQLVVVALALRQSGEAARRRPLERDLLRRALGQGWPIGLQRLAEMGIFSVTGVLMARIGTRAVATHQVVMTLVTTTFMVPLGISAAASVRVGRAVGAGDRAGLRRAGFVAFAMAMVFMGICSAAMLVFPRPLASVLTDEAPVLDAAETLLVIGALFQISDGLQIVGAGALRGLGDTRVVLYLNLLGHYGLGVPIGVALAFAVGWGGAGLWWGLFIGLTVVAVALVARFVWRSARAVVRV
jgi:MATE family multidrug resistance protein